MATNHQSDSRVQRQAEAVIVHALAAQLGLDGALHPKRLPTLGGTFVQVDACSQDGNVLVEAYARQGVLKGAQIKKISQDILKLAMLKGDAAAPESRAIIVFASEEALSSITGWVRAAADHFGVELLVVDIPEPMREEIRAAQARQVMVNVEVSADELAEDISVTL